MLQTVCYLIAYTSELAHDILLGTDSVGRIIESDMNTMLYVTGKAGQLSLAPPHTVMT